MLILYSFSPIYSIGELALVNTLIYGYNFLIINNLLQDVLKNQDLDLDYMFIASLVADLIKVKALKMLSGD